ncbi:TIM23 complex component [Cladochytrium tenue]|nr:TIM23 complex component [Cladochytrium tenue]
MTPKLPSSWLHPAPTTRQLLGTASMAARRYTLGHAPSSVLNAVKLRASPACSAAALSILPASLAQQPCRTGPTSTNPTTSIHRRQLSASSCNRNSNKNLNPHLLRRPASRADPETPVSRPSAATAPSGAATKAAKRAARPTPVSATPSSSTGPSAPTASSSAALQWAEYFRLRRSLKLSERTGAVAGGVGTFMASSYYLMAVADFDPEPIWGMDPSVLYGAGAFGMAFAGAAGGMLLGATAWRALQGSSVLRAIDTRDRDFFERIKAVRPADVGLSLNNPLPDYYAEKVTSLADYRRWLRKMREYRIKTEGFKHVRTTFKGHASSLHKRAPPPSILGRE